MRPNRRDNEWALTFSKPKSRGTRQTPILTKLARLSDATQVNSLLLEFLKVPDKARIGEIRRSIRQEEILVSTVKRHAAGKERVIGFIHGALHNDPISAGPLLYVTALYVTRPYRNKGIGSELLNSIIQRSVRNSSIRGVEVGTARKHALKFYLKRGFRQFRADFGEKLLGLDIKEWKAVPLRTT